MRDHGRRLAAATALALAAFGTTLAAGAAAATTPGPSAPAPGGGPSPCDHAPGVPWCVAALGPLRDVTAAWTAYQAATIQVVPISDYRSDPEDAPPPLGVGVCGGEHGAPGPDGTPVPGVVASSPPRGVPAPPGTHGPYCILRYLADDFTAPCATCHRVLIDFASIPTGTVTSPGADGHFAARFDSTLGFSATLPFNGHSPNIKNLCADKFFNPSPGATCTRVRPFDEYGGGLEGDTAVYHHFPLEGRYYNGPAYLAGSGTRHDPYHWVRGAYFDIDTGGAAGGVWYGTGYRGAGDVLPDTDQSYACLCEVPPAGHAAFSPTYALGAVAGPGSSGGRRGATSPPGGAAVAGSSSGAAAVTALPLTAAPGGAGAAPTAGLLLLAGWLRRRRVRGAGASTTAQSQV